MTLQIRGAVLGSPIEHSLSPILHLRAFELLGIAGSYSAIEVKGGELGNFIREEGENFDYLSLTMPLKEEVLELEEVLQIDIDTLGRRIQSINTLVRDGAKWSATSTDGLGFLRALENRGYTRFQRVLILGAGGTARAIAGALEGIADAVDVMGRSVRRNAPITHCFESMIPNFIIWDDAHDLSIYDLVVNTTPAGAADRVAENLSASIDSLFFDILYKPWPTALAQRWSDAGGNIIGGLDLLLYQGIEQLKLATHRETRELGQELRLALSNAVI
jgi:shikimate dehydrogenase